MKRQQVLANNIANADTPNFKARDFDFRSELERAVQQGRNTTGTGLATTQKGHIQGGKPQFTVDNLQYRNPHQARMDGNTVDMDMEAQSFSSTTRCVIKQACNLLMVVLKACELQCSQNNRSKSHEYVLDF